MSEAAPARRYDLAGTMVEVSSSHEALAAAFDAIIEPFRLEGRAVLSGLDPDPEEGSRRDFGANPPATGVNTGLAFRIEIDGAGPDEPPAKGELVYRGPVLEEGEAICLQAGQTIYFAFPGRISLTLDAEWRSARLALLPAQVGQLGQTAGMLALEAALDAGGQQMVHAAGLVAPARDGIVLVHAPSGTGKTTTALALALAGFALASDDAVVLRTGDGGIAAWGFPRALKVHRDTARLLPAVAPLLGDAWDVNGEQGLGLAALATLAPTATPAPRPVLALFSLARAADGKSHVTAMRRTDALAALAADNVRTGLTGLLPLQQRRYRALARLVTEVPCFRLTMGSDPGAAASLVFAALDRLPSTEG